MQVATRAQPFGAALHQGDLELGRLLEKLPAAAYTCDAQGLITFFNERAVELWGRAPKLNDPADRYCGSFRLFSPGGPPIRHDKCWMALALRDQRGYDGHEIVIERPDSSRRIAAAHANPFFDQQGRLAGAVNVLVDITDRKQTEERLRRSEQELADFFENAIVGLHWVGPDGTILRANRADFALLGYTRDEYVGRPIGDFHADGAVIEDILRRLRAGEELQDFEARLRAKDGSIRHVLISSNVLWENGQFIHTRCFTRDITDRKRTAEALRQQTERLGLLWEAAAVLLMADDPDAMLHGLLAKIGPQLGVDAYVHYLVNDTGDGLRLASSHGIPTDSTDAIARLQLGQAISGTVALHREPIVATCVQRSDDPKVDFIRSLGLRAYVCNPLLIGDALLGTLSFASRSRDLFDSDELTFFQTLCHYVTVAYERLRLLGQLKEGDRRKDEFLAMLAHELRNPLAPVRNAVQLLCLRGSEGPELESSRAIIERQVDHLTRLIDDLIDVSRITRDNLELRKQRVELTEVIQGAIEASRPAIEQKRHTLTVSLPPEPIFLDADLMRLTQVFMNLLNNAAKYTPPGGQIWLTTEMHGSEVEVRVRDSGVGVPAEKLPFLFEMFFQVDRSPARSEGGLGIGLSLVKRLVELHGGRVEATSDGAGAGSELIVQLPTLVDETKQGEPEAVAIERAAEASAGRRILVVDDNRDSADSLAMLLRLSGNEAHAAYDGLEGIEAAELLRPDVVLLDIRNAEGRRYRGLPPHP